MTDYKFLMSIFAQEEGPAPETGHRVRIPRRPRKSALVYSDAVLFDKYSRTTSLQDVITSNSVTLLFFGSPKYPSCVAFLEQLKSLFYRGLELNKLLDVVYIPVFTHQETQQEVEEDFLERHGDWWMMRFRSWEALEARFIHPVTVLPSLVVLDAGGAVVTECGQNDLDLHGNDVLITWF